MDGEILMTKVRKSILIKLDNRTEATQQRISNWLDQQGNATASVLSIIEHMIERFGYVDMMDHEISKILFSELLDKNQGKQESTHLVATTDPISQSEETKVEEVKSDTPISNSAAKEEEVSPKTKNAESDIDFNSF